MKDFLVVIGFIATMGAFGYFCGYTDGKQKQEGRIHEEAIHAGVAYYLTNYSGEKVFCWKTQEERP